MFKMATKLRMIKLFLFTMVLFAALAVGTTFFALGGPAQLPASTSPLDLAYIQGTGRGVMGGEATPTVAVVDMKRLSVVNTFPERDLVGTEPGHYLAVSPDGKYIWNSQNISPTGGYVQVLDAATGEQINQWDVGAGVGMHMTRDRRQNGLDGQGSTRSPQDPHYLFVTSTETNSINVFDVENQTHLGAIPIGSAPHVIDTTSDGNILWTTGPGSTARAYDISGLPDTLPVTPIASVPVGGSLHALLVHPNDKYVFVGSSTLGTNVIDTSTNTIVATNIEGMVLADDTPHNLEISPDANTLIIGSEMIHFMDISTLNTASPDMSLITVAHELDMLDQGPARASHQNYTRDGKHILVTTTRVNTVRQGELLVLNADTLLIEKILPMPDNPHGIAYPGDNR